MCNRTKEFSRDSNGQLSAYVWPGGYPIYYLLADGACLCPDCANGRNGSDAKIGHEDKQWRIVAQDIHWEGDPIQCEHCYKDIESAYGPVDSD